VRVGFSARPAGPATEAAEDAGWAEEAADVDVRAVEPEADLVRPASWAAGVVIGSAFAVARNSVTKPLAMLCRSICMKKTRKALFAEAARGDRV